MALEVKNLPANAGDLRDAGSVPGLRRSPGKGHGNPFQYSCLKNPMERGAWQATVHRVEESQTQLKGFSTHTHTHTFFSIMSPFLDQYLACSLLKSLSITHI